MKHFGCVCWVLVALTGGARAGTPDTVKALLDQESFFYEFNEPSQQWVFKGGGTASERCEEKVKEATKAGVADTLEVDVAFSTPDWKAGKHTFADLKALCARVKTPATIEGWLNNFDISSKPGFGVMAAKCINTFEEALSKKEVDPSWKLPYEGLSIKDPATGDPFVGTLGDAKKKFCDAFAQDYLAERAAAEAPYRKALKGDKLDLALKEQVHYDHALYGAGKLKLETPAQLAKAKVWFTETWYDANPCNGGRGKEYVVWRYAFDAKSKLLSADSKTYCGAPAKSKFK
jgi:hypothetical protein